jgi:hypothetical protein
MFLLCYPQSPLPPPLSCPFHNNFLVPPTLFLFGEVKHLNNMPHQLMVMTRAAEYDQTMRPKARGLAHHGGQPVWLQESDPAGVILYVNGPYRLPFPYHTGCPDRS